MARSFLAILRDADGRSLARALALLLLVSGVSDAFHFGIAASAGPGPAFVLCTNEGASTDNPAAPSTPRPRDHEFCCVLGCPSLHPTVTASTEDVLAIPSSPGSSAEPVWATSVHPAARPASIRARGPPALV